jgi:hypothetical protein
MGRTVNVPTEADPIVGNWYEHLDRGQAFEVVALDEDGGTIEVQYFDGSVEEIGLESWYELEIEPSEPPEDWTGAMDDIERDDLGYSETEMASEDWSAPLRGLKSRPAAREEETPEEQDDWGDGLPDEEPWEEED